MESSGKRPNEYEKGKGGIIYPLTSNSLHFIKDEDGTVRVNPDWSYKESDVYYAYIDYDPTNPECGNFLEAFEDNYAAEQQDEEECLMDGDDEYFEFVLGIIQANPTDSENENLKDVLSYSDYMNLMVGRVIDFYVKFNTLKYCMSKTRYLGFNVSEIENERLHLTILP